MQTSSEAGIESDVVAQFVKQAKPKTDKAIFHLLVWSWGVLIASVAVYCAFPSIWTFALAFLVITSRMGALLALAHDAQHSAFLPNKKWNDLIGAWFCAYPMGSIFGSSRAVHMAHHKLLNTPDDPDRNFHIEHDKSTPRQFVVHFARLVFGGQLWTSIVVNGFLRPKSAPVNGNGNGNGSSKPVVVVNRTGHPEILNLVPVQLVIWGSLWLASGQWWLYLSLWLGPIFTLGTFLGFLRGFVDHARLATEEEGVTSGRLITVVKTNWLERAFLAPFHFNYHGEHHLFPAVPPYYLPQLHKLLQSEPTYRNRYGVRPSYGQFLSDYWRQISRSAEPQGQTAPDHS